MPGQTNLHADFGGAGAYGIPFAIVPASQPKVAIHYTAYRDSSATTRSPPVASLVVVHDSDVPTLGSGKGVPDLDAYYAAVSDHVLQAVSMLRSELDCDFTEALGRLRIRATAADQTLDEVALDVIGHAIRFTD